MTTPVSAPTVELPIPLTSLIGREHALADVAGLLRTDDHRLVTLTGPGGVGKTRLAIHAAALVADCFPDGTVFVDLAPVRDSSLVAPTIADAIGLKAAGDDLLSRLAGHLSGKQAILLIDNFEHVVDAATSVAYLLGRCPRLTVLATSRVPLRLAGEHEYNVPPLGFGTGETLGIGGDEENSDAVRLFAARAQAILFDFSVDDHNASQILAICRRLDGLPLAIELAAARIRTLSPSALLAQLDQRLPMLTGGPRDAPDRQRTMRDAIAWSYDLLPPREQRLFRRLGVFVGGFTLEAAEAVGRQTANGRRQNESRPADRQPPTTDSVLDGIEALVENNLLRPVGGPDDPPRFAMLETIREFVQELLDTFAETESARRSQADYFTLLAESADPYLLAPEGAVWLRRLESEHDNFRAALTWLDANASAPDLLRLAGALRHFWHLHTHYAEGRRWLEHALAGAELAPDAWLARAIGGVGIIALYQGEDSVALVHVQECARIWDRIGEGAEYARMLLTMGVLSSREREFRRALELTEEAVVRFQAIGDRHPIAHPLLGMGMSNIGQFTYQLGETERADVLLHEALAMQQAAEYHWGAAITLARLGQVARTLGDPERAATHYWAGLAAARSVGDWRVICWNLTGLAIVIAAREPDRAIRLTRAIRQIVSITGQEPAMPWLTGSEPAVAMLKQTNTDEPDTGHTWLTAEQAYAEAMSALAEAGSPSDDGLSSRVASHLTRREREVLVLVAAGMTDRQIAESLHISRRTAAGHVANILGKLGLPSRSAAAAFAVRHDLA